VGRTVGVLKEATTNFIKTVKEMGLTINVQKTKYMKVTKRPSDTRMLKLEDQNLKE
jgi:hypothetical protein